MGKHSQRTSAKTHSRSFILHCHHCLKIHSEFGKETIVVLCMWMWMHQSMNKILKILFSVGKHKQRAITRTNSNLSFYIDDSGSQRRELILIFGPRRLPLENILLFVNVKCECINWWIQFFNSFQTLENFHRNRAFNIQFYLMTDEVQFMWCRCSNWIIFLLFSRQQSQQ